ncbi:MAG: hypothetical protein IT382_04105 [Deltaproteobacteria bacterium]|nr:hypothetical protein [Deltaproteobacteria bacterium]
MFVADIDESRQTMAMLALARPRAPVGVVTLGVEPTVSIARAPSLPNARSKESPAVKEPTEPTHQMQKPQEAPRRRAPVVAIAAAVALGGALVGALVARQLAPPAPASALDAGRAAAFDAGVEARDAGVLTLALVDAGAAPPSAPGTGPDAPAMPDAGLVATDVDNKPPVSKGAAGKKNGKKVPIKKTPEPPVTTEPPPVEAPPVESPGKRYGALDWGGRVDELTRRCSSLACTAAVAAHHDDYGKLDETAFRQWGAAVRACWQSCKLPE